MALSKQNNSFEVFGLEELQNMFKQLPKQLSEQKIWQKFWRENSKPLVKAAKQKASAIKETGQLSKSIGYFTTKASRRTLGGYVGPRVKGAFKDMKKSGYYGAWVEYGAEVKLWGKYPSSKGNQKFMRPAYDETKGTILINASRDGVVTMDKLIKSHVKRTEKYGILGR